jgi:hypothetical protein
MVSSPASSISSSVDSIGGRRLRQVTHHVARLLRAMCSSAIANWRQPQRRSQLKSGGRCAPLSGFTAARSQPAGQPLRCHTRQGAYRRGSSRRVRTSAWRNPRPVENTRGRGAVTEQALEFGSGRVSKGKLVDAEDPRALEPSGRAQRHASAWDWESHAAQTA